MKFLKRIIVPLLILSASLIVSLVIAEYVVRYIFMDITTTSDGASYFGQRWAHANAGQFNTQGFREREILPYTASKRFRIALVGDSFTYGQGIDMDARLSNRLEKMLNTDADSYEVFNFGKGGAETLDHIEFLNEYVLDTHPDFILLQWFINDVEGRDYQGRPSYLRLIPSDRITRYLHEHSAAFFLVNNAWQQLQVGIGIGPAFTYTEYLVERFSDPDSVSATSAQRALDQFIDICEEHRIPVGIIVFPELTGNYSNGYPLNFLLDRVLETCTGRGIQCVDLRPVFEMDGSQDKLWVNRYDSHPGEYANELAARATYNTFSSTWKSLNTGNSQPGR